MEPMIAGKLARILNDLGRAQVGRGEAPLPQTKNVEMVLFARAV